MDGGNQGMHGANGNDLGMAFLHGAGLGAWIWRDVAGLLPFPTLAVDFPGRDGRPPSPGLSFQDYVRHVMAILDTWPPSRIILVTHSIGGAVGLMVASLLGPRLAGFAAVSAAIPAGGGSFLSTLPFPARLAVAAMIRLAGTRPPDAAIRKSLCNGLSPSQADEVVRRYVAEAPGLFREPCGAHPPGVPSLYIKTFADRDYPLKSQDASARLLHDPRVVNMDAGHLPMLARPAELAAALERFAGVHAPA